MDHTGTTFQKIFLLLIITVFATYSTPTKEKKKQTESRNTSFQGNELKTLLNRKTLKKGDLDETQELVRDLVHEVASTISEDIGYASKMFGEKGGMLSDQESDEFFQQVAQQTLSRIERDIKQLDSLVNNKEETAAKIAAEIAEITKKMNVKTMANPSSANEMVAMAKTFIYEALSSV